MTSGGGGLGAYLAVLGTGAAVRPFAAAVVARLPIAMAPLGAILLVEETTGSYALAGLVAGAYAVGTGVGSPVWGRCIDRYGQARVLAPTVTASGLLLATLALVGAAGAGLTALLLFALASGGTAPPFSSAMRMTWRAVLPRHRWRTGYALDASAVEAVFVGGPLLLSQLLLVLPAAGPLLVTAALHVTGGLLYATSEPARRSPEGALPLDGPLAATTGDGRAPRSARVLTPPLVAVLVVGLVMAVAFGFVDTSLVATARDVLQDESRLGLLFAAIAGGSVTGGLGYGLLAGSATEHRRVPVLLAGFASGLAVLALLLARPGAPALVVLLPVLFTTGLCIAPGLILQQALVDGLAPDGRRGESQAWLSTATVTGGAGGTAVAGVLVEGGGPALALGAGAVAVAASAALAVLAQPAWARRAVPVPPR